MGLCLNTWAPLNWSGCLHTEYSKQPQLPASAEKTGRKQNITIGQIQLIGHNEQRKKNILIVENQLQTVTD